MLQQYKRKGDDKLGLLEQSEWMKPKDGTVYESRLLKLEKQLTDLLAKSSQSKVSITPLQLCVLQSTFLFLKIFPKSKQVYFRLPFTILFDISMFTCELIQQRLTLCLGIIFLGVSQTKGLYYNSVSQRTEDNKTKAFLTERVHQLNY